MQPWSVRNFRWRRRSALASCAAMPRRMRRNLCMRSQCAACRMRRMLSRSEARRSASTFGCHARRGGFGFGSGLGVRVEAHLRRRLLVGLHEHLLHLRRRPGVRGGGLRELLLERLLGRLVREALRLRELLVRRQVRLDGVARLGALVEHPPQVANLLVLLRRGRPRRRELLVEGVLGALLLLPQPLRALQPLLLPVELPLERVDAEVLLR
mmetsp:Transcript_45049/g.141093  ORF Transcript_45049/g.141093 Transcript_45049/m.141093 type:complete len:211 (+) Transcript_45049:61-693(+)